MGASATPIRRSHASAATAPEEAAGRTPSFLATDRSHALEGILRTVAERGEPWCGECTWRSRDGSTLVVTGSVSPVHDGDGTLSSLVCVQRDITETRHLERSLNTARKLEAVGRLAAGIAHEINTPAQYARDNTVFIEEALPPILALLEAQAAVVEAARSAGVAETLLEAVKEAEEAAQLDFVAAELPSAIASVKEGLDRIARIVRAMKDFAHPSDGKMEACDLNAVAEASVTVAQNEWKHHAEVELDFQEDLPSVTCIRDEVGQVILNLIVNATHAIAETGERGRIRVRTRAEGECVELRVEDTGTGIPKAVRDKVFDPFFTTKEVGKGTGQGLALAHSVIVETHQGQIDFETEEGEGTTFIVRIPCQPPEARSDDARPLRG
ncbi:MAG: PAS domain S-box protein [Deltaproteobacteria bacterium]|nr:MAG: PAS domain S-box protein [Deltaproteobacteria bacterium]